MSSSIQHEVTNAEIRDLNEEINRLKLKETQRAAEHDELADTRKKLQLKHDELTATIRQLEDASADCQRLANMNEKSQTEIEQAQS